MTLKIIRDPKQFRLNIREEIGNKISNVNNATNLEIGIYNYAINEAERMKIVKQWDNHYFVLIYITHFKSIMTNLTPVIISQIESSELLPQQVAYMTHQELEPTKWLKLIERKNIADKSQFENNIKATTDTFTCRKCNSNQCSYYLLQTRCADEPMTCYVTCLDCGKRWKT